MPHVGISQKARESSHFIPWAGSGGVRFVNVEFSTCHQLSYDLPHRTEYSIFSCPELARTGFEPGTLSNPLTSSIVDFHNVYLWVICI